MKEHVAKLFASKGEANSHIWIEGERLHQAGFALDVEYHQIWYKDALVLSVGPYFTEAREPLKTITRKVVKSGKHPAIRIEGKRVLDTFGKISGQVHVEFHPGFIEITPYKDGTVGSVPRCVQTERESEAVVS